MAAKRNSDPSVQASKFLSLILRHDPAAAGVTLDDQGWVAIDHLLEGMAGAGTQLTPDELTAIVAEDNKSRYSIKDGKIRANQGHSIPVDLGLVAQQPPDFLFHGTAERFLASILEHGLRPGQRQHVHLSTDISTAVTVGKRHGQPIVLRILAGDLHSNGQEFYLSDNNVWRTEAIDPNYVRVDDGT